MSVVVSVGVVNVPIIGPPLARVTPNIRSLWTAYYGATGGWTGGDEATGTVPWDGDMPVGLYPLQAPDPIPFNRG